MRKPELSSVYWILFTICLVTAFFQFDVTIAILRDWWQVKHPPRGFFVVPQWWTHYTVMSALYSPIWVVCIGSTILLARRWLGFAVFLLAGFLILEPISCMAMPGIRGGYGYLLGLEELPIAGAERDSNAIVSMGYRPKTKAMGSRSREFSFQPKGTRRCRVH